jgi:hypothetical protein
MQNLSSVYNTIENGKGDTDSESQKTNYTERIQTNRVNISYVHIFQHGKYSTTQNNYGKQTIKTDFKHIGCISP